MGLCPGTEYIGVAKGRAWGLKGNGKNCTTVSAVQKGQIYVKVLCLVVIVNVNVTKYVPQKCQI